MGKKDLQAAAAGVLDGMRQTPAQRIAQAAAPQAAQEQAAQEPTAQEQTVGDVKKKKTDNTAPFTIWTTPENVRRWKAYQKAKKATLKTQNDFIVAAVTDYMQAHPVTDEEKAELLKTLEL